MIPASPHDCTLLLVDDEEANLDLLEGFLEVEGYRSLVRTTDARRAIPLYEEHRPDLVLLDLHMPFRTGFDVLRDIVERTPADDYLPVLVLTADVTPEVKERALGSGARDFLTKPFDAVEVLLRVRNLLEARLLHRLQRQARSEAEAAQARSALLAEASRVLGGSLDSATTLSQLAHLLAPGMAQACAVLVREGDRLVPAGVATAGEGEGEEPGGAIAALRGAVAAAADGGLALEVLGGSLGTAPRRLLLTPLQAQRRVLGALLLARSPESEPFALEDEALAEELAARAALAVENARLFADAEWATRARDRMLSVVAHDLRNPLAVVAMYSEMLLNFVPPDGDPYQRDALEGIGKSTTRMQKLIEDLLDVSRLQQGTFSLESSPHSVDSLLREAERMLRPLADARSIALRLERPAQEGIAAVEADGARVLQVLSNLVGNALKFTPDGGRVTVSWTPTEGGVRISVADTGPGIPADQLPHIFGAFWQARSADRRGVGLGLWISRAIVEAHGGRIWVDSREGEGAVFHFTLPAPDAPADEPRLVAQQGAWVG